jgi:hypothetical protein
MIMQILQGIDLSWSIKTIYGVIARPMSHKVQLAHSSINIDQIKRPREESGSGNNGYHLITLKSFQYAYRVR